MPSLLSLVRQSILVNAAKALRPTDDDLERRRCEAWFAIRRAFPNVHTGRLEATIHEGVQRNLRQLERGLSVLSRRPANDTARLAATAVAQ